MKNEYIEEKQETAEEPWYFSLDIEAFQIKFSLCFNGHEFEQALGDGEDEGNLVCCSPWGHKQLDTAERLNNKNSIEAFQVRFHYVSTLHFTSNI